ncbi:MAG: alpha-glucan family phosphorylase [Desulfobacterales bacterium]|nr:MAG: alpha-glucan family phosphorylase [Desulfobacterales bacterium]
MKIQQNIFPTLPQRISGLGELAENLWWSWNPAARMLFKTLDRQAWKESVHNPDKMLKELPKEILEAAAGNPDYLRQYDVVMSRFKKYIETKACPLLPDMPDPGISKIAYFSAEYGLHRSLPFYAGGLGFLAGDHLKECSDSNVPLVAVGFMYPEGYLLQRIREDGWQENITETLQREAAAINKVLNDDGAQLIVKVPLIEPPIYVAVWRVDVGRVPLYLMDTYIELNEPWNRGISARLYTGDLEQRLRQEIVLGIGGAEVLETLGIKRFLLHLNEGHAAFALLEQIRDRINQGMDFQKAVELVRNTAIFTTHTPVPAGHDVFPFHLIEKYFHSYWPCLKLDRDEFLKLGIHPEKPEAGFNMTALALRLSKYRNGVSKKHGEVSRRMWQSLWAEFPEGESAIDHITNGVHVPTWIEPKMQLLLDKHLGPGWMADHDNPLIWELIDKIPDEELWKTHYWLKIKLIDAIRERSRLRWTKDQANPSVVLAGGALLDPSVLTIGFARRFATYKRADLLFYDFERLKMLLNDRWRPVQIIFAGKAHPADDPGKQILQRIFNASRNPDMGGRIAFVEDYGEQLAQYLVHGVDVWLNTPLPPMEASGTSGMKAAVNGVPQLSILDGWWIEGFNGKNGWAIDPKEIDGNRDQVDAAEIYRTLEEEIIPWFYDVSEEGVPNGWVRVMKASIKSTAARFSARRMVKEYIEKFYSVALKNI